MSEGTAERESVPVAEARDIILGSIQPLGTETIGLQDALGRVLSEEILAGRSIPPADNSAMDGFAVRAADCQRVPAVLKVVATAPAGRPAPQAVGEGEAIRIFTGAAVPRGADAVVMQEYAELASSEVTILKSPSAGEHIRRAGSDVIPETVIADSGTRLRPAHIGMIAALGRTQLRVAARPRVAILATGDELVEPDRLTDDGRIVTSNSYGLIACLHDIGALPVYLGIARDRPADIEAAFQEALRCDAVISTGGVSVGDYDWIKQVLANLGGTMRLWRVRMKPGAPLAFVMMGHTPVFGLPGNPVSTLVSFEQFVRPAILRMMGRHDIFRPVEPAILGQDYEKPAGRLHYVRVRLSERDGQRYALVAGDQGSGILLSMVRANGLAILPEDVTQVRAGSEVAVQLIDRTDLRETPGH